MVDQIQATPSVLSNSTNKASSTLNVNRTSFSDTLFKTMSSNDLKDDQANKEGGCCGGGNNRDEALVFKALG